MSKLYGIATVVFALLALVAFVKRNTFSDSMVFGPEIHDDPLQFVVADPVMTIHYADVLYQVEPLFDYQIYGLVVSYRHHSGERMLHKLWNDHLNMADLCIVWGSNATDLALNQFDFWNGQFTCNIRTRDTVAWQSFVMRQLSNNHLLSADDVIRDKIGDVRIGDVVRIRGKLASYSANGQTIRGTSITRDDTGNGACETVFVEDFQIVSRMRSLWRTLLWPSLFLLVISMVAYFNAPVHRH